MSLPAAPTVTQMVGTNPANAYLALAAPEAATGTLELYMAHIEYECNKSDKAYLNTAGAPLAGHLMETRYATHCGLSAAGYDSPNLEMLPQSLEEALAIIPNMLTSFQTHLRRIYGLTPQQQGGYNAALLNVALRRIAYTAHVMTGGGPSPHQVIFQGFAAVWHFLFVRACDHIVCLRPSATLANDINNSGGRPLLRALKRTTVVHAPVVTVSDIIAGAPAAGKKPSGGAGDKPGGGAGDKPAAGPAAGKAAGGGAGTAGRDGRMPKPPQALKLPHIIAHPPPGGDAAVISWHDRKACWYCGAGKAECIGQRCNRPKTYYALPHVDTTMQYKNFEQSFYATNDSAPRPSPRA